ncbi:hypothetical protein [Candidatus Magnetominusculus dajiuhuensis]|uniref:hypothetical protein n=1 Tax=Candidatus Magnetominusculus dajiuhuensis TaxID=3137712 RepID=UPI003B42E845
MKVLKGLAVLVLVLASVLVINTHAQAAAYCWVAQDGNAAQIHYLRLSLANYGNGHYLMSGTDTVYSATTFAALSVSEVGGPLAVTSNSTTKVSTVAISLTSVGGGTTDLSATRIQMLLDAGLMSGVYYRTFTDYASTNTSESRYDGVATLTVCSSY